MTERAHITLVVDRSGSMKATRADAEGGIKGFLDEQRKLDGVDVQVALVEFDHAYERVYGPLPLGEAPEYALVPRGMTRLRDAVARAISDTRLWTGEVAQAPTRVVIVIMTDGEENDSRDVTFDELSRLIEEAKAAGIEFVFLAGTLSSARLARSSGLRGQTMAFDGGDGVAMAAAYSTAATNTSRYLSGRSANVSMPDDLSQVDSDAP